MSENVTIAEIEAAIAALDEGTPEYHEAVAFYLLTLARAQWRIADRMYAQQALRDFTKRERIR